MIIPPILKQLVGFLHVYKDGQFLAIGTCFFINVVEDDLVFDYIVTCKHVIEAAEGLPIYVRLNRTDIMDVDYLRIRTEWIYHDDPTVDIAIASNLGDPDNHNPVRSSTMTLEAIVSEDTIIAPLPEGMDVAFVGLFAQYHGRKRNFPVVRQGKLALVTNELVNGVYGPSYYYFIECDAYPGHSGSPVFIPAKVTGSDISTYAILGLVSAFYPDQQQVFIENNELKVYTNFGISLVTPSFYIKEILEKEVFVRRRKDRIGAMEDNNKPTQASLVVPQEVDRIPLTRSNFEEALRKVSRPDKPDNG